VAANLVQENNYVDAITRPRPAFWALTSPDAFSCSSLETTV
jgi:hypothetical protein